MQTPFAMSFNTIASLYNSARPGYPGVLYSEIEKIKKFGCDSKILEVGAGPGTATIEIYKKWRSNMVAVEPGHKLIAIAEEKCSEFGKIKFVNNMFEDYKAVDLFDGILSATAFHWPDKNVKYKKAYELLKNDGILAVYWNNYSRSENKIFDRIQKVYEKHHPAITDFRDFRIQVAERIKQKSDEISKSGWFTLVKHFDFSYDKTFTSQEYINLLKSFSGNSTIEKSEIDIFYKKILEIIESNGGAITLPVIVNLEVAKKNLDYIKLN